MIDSSTSLLAAQSHDIVRFAMGSPAAEAIPTKVLAAIGAEEVGEASPDAFDYAATEGDLPLREALLRASRARATPPRSTGSRSPPAGCRVSTWPSSCSSTRATSWSSRRRPTPTAARPRCPTRPTCSRCRSTTTGWTSRRWSGWSARPGVRRRVIYTVPTFQNPSGATLSLERRQRLIELARSWGSVLLDDDPYGMLRFAGQDVPTLHELGGRRPAGLLGPDLLQDRRAGPPRRLGRHRPVAAAAADQRQAGDGHLHQPPRPAAGRPASWPAATSTTTWRTQRAEYRRRKEAMQDALAELFGGRARWTDPEGGFFLWLTFRRGRHRGAVPRRPRGGRRLHPRQRVLAEPAVPGRAAAVLRLDHAGAHPRGAAAAGPRGRPGGRVSRVSPDEQAVLDLLDEDELVSLTRALVRVPGENPPGQEQATADALASGAATAGSTSRSTRSRPGGPTWSRPSTVATVPACCCSATPTWSRSAPAGARTRSRPRSATAGSTAAAVPT